MSELALLIHLATAEIEINKQLTAEEIDNEIVWDTFDWYLSDRVKQILDERNVDYMTYLHFSFDTSEEWNTIRKKVAYIINNYNIIKLEMEK